MHTHIRMYYVAFKVILDGEIWGFVSNFIHIYDVYKHAFSHPHTYILGGSQGYSRRSNMGIFRQLCTGLSSRYFRGESEAYHRFERAMYIHTRIHTHTHTHTCIHIYTRTYAYVYCVYTMY